MKNETNFTKFYGTKFPEKPREKCWDGMQEIKQVLPIYNSSFGIYLLYCTFHSQYYKKNELLCTVAQVLQLMYVHCTAGTVGTYCGYFYVILAYFGVQYSWFKGTVSRKITGVKSGINR